MRIRKDLAIHRMAMVNVCADLRALCPCCGNPTARYLNEYQEINVRITYSHDPGMMIPNAYLWGCMTCDARWWDVYDVTARLNVNLSYPMLTIRRAE